MIAVNRNWSTIPKLILIQEEKFLFMPYEMKERTFLGERTVNEMFSMDGVRTIQATQRNTYAEINQSKLFQTPKCLCEVFRKCQTKIVNINWLLPHILNLQEGPTVTKKGLGNKWANNEWKNSSSTYIVLHMCKSFCGLVSKEDNNISIIMPRKKNGSW